MRTLVPRTCRVCSEDFGVVPSRAARGQGVYCSRSCYLDGLAPEGRGCETCARPLTREQLVHTPRVRFCSRACVPRRTPTVMLEVLELLRGNAHSYMTASDLSIWTYGHDDAAEVAAIKMHIYRLRALGYEIVSRSAPWACPPPPEDATNRQTPRAYRLVAEPMTARSEAA